MYMYASAHNIIYATKTIPKPLICKLLIYKLLICYRHHSYAKYPLACERFPLQVVSAAYEQYVYEQFAYEWFWWQYEQFV